MSTPKVIFIGGHGRSGTTIMDRVLSELTGAFSAGEVHRFWKYGLAQDWRCSCGESLRDCDFWGTVLPQAFSEAGCSEQDVLEMWTTVARPHSLIALHYPCLRSTGFRRQLARYRSFLSALYRAVSEHSGKRVIVDSSGSPLHGYILSGLRDVEVDMIHLVRDARAVAFSNQRRKPNPGAKWDSVNMRTKSPLHTSATWQAYNLILERLPILNGKVGRVKYEELFESPEREFGKIAEKLEIRTSSNPFCRMDVVKISSQHTGQGNPSRFGKGRTKLKVDREWRMEMSELEKRVVGNLCWILLGKYEYE